MNIPLMLIYVLTNFRVIRLGSLRESNNFLMLGLKNLNVMLPATTSNKNLLRKFSVRLMRHGAPKFQNPDTLNTILLGMKTLAFIALLRGFPHHSVEIFETCQRLIRCVLTDLESHSKEQSDRSSVQSGSNTFLPIRTQKSILKIKYSRINAYKSLGLLALHGDNHHQKLKLLTLFNVALEDVGDTANAEDQTDPSLLYCRAYHAFVRAEFSEASDHLSLASEQSLLDGNLQNHNFALLWKAWLAFLSGARDVAERAIATIIQYSTSASNYVLHIWVLELDIIMKAIAGDFEGAEHSLSLLNSAKRGSKYRATTSAVVAYMYSLKGDYLAAAPLAVYACKQLTSRRQGSPISGILLFISLNAVLDIIDAHTNATLQASERRFSFQGMLSLSDVRGTLSMRPPIDILELKQATHDSMKALSHASMIFAVLQPLYWAASARIIRLHDYAGYEDYLEYVNTNIRDNHHKFRQSCFAMAYAQYQRFIMYRDLESRGVLKSRASPEREESRNNAKFFFSQLGCTLPELVDPYGDEIIADPEPDINAQSSRGRGSMERSVGGGMTSARPFTCWEDEEGLDEDPPSLLLQPAMNGGHRRRSTKQSAASMSHHSDYSSSVMEDAVEK